MTAATSAVPFHRVHVVGASGSGTSTLGRTLAEQLQWPFFDTDAFYWLPSDPPFVHKRDIPDRIRLLDAELSQHDNWVLSGSLAGWGDIFIPYFTDVVFLTLDPAVRLARLEAREAERYGAARLRPGGELHDAHEAFMAWAALYDVTGHSHRSLEVHEAWLAQLPEGIKVHRLNSERPPAELAGSIRRCIAAQP